MVAGFGNGSAPFLKGGLLYDPTERLAVLQGFFGMAPSVDHSGAAYQAYLARLQALPSTAGNGPSNLAPL